MQPARYVASRTNHVGYHNESFNAIWERIPKASYVSLSQLQLGVFHVISNFNVGRRVSVSIYQFMNIIPGKYTLLGCNRINSQVTSIRI